MAEFAHRERAIEEPLPWQVVDIVVTDEYLKKEYQRAVAGVTTPDCREACHGCFGKAYETDCRIS